MTDTSSQIDISNLANGNYSITFSGNVAGTFTGAISGDDTTLSVLNNSNYNYLQNNPTPDNDDEVLDYFNVDIVDASNSDVITHNLNTLDYILQLVSLDPATLYQVLVGVTVTQAANTITIASALTAGYNSYRVKILRKV